MVEKVILSCTYIPTLTIRHKYNLCNTTSPQFCKLTIYVLGSSCYRIGTYVVFTIDFINGNKPRVFYL